jgi:hypothetical protein
MTHLTLKAGLAATMIAFGSVPLAAQDGPQEAFARAAASLDARLGSVEDGPAIGTTDAVANAADLATIETAVGALGSPAFPLDGFTTFETVCEPLNRLSVRHTMDGAASLRRPADAAPPSPAEVQAFTAQLQSLQLHNANLHQDAITILSGSGLTCTAKHFPVLAAHLASLPPAEITPVRLNGARQMRLGIARAVLGFMMALGDTTITPANKTRLRAYVSDLAVPLAAALTPELRSELVTALGQLPASDDPDAKAANQVLTAALATSQCAELCLYR